MFVVVFVVILWWCLFVLLGFLFVCLFVLELLFLLFVGGFGGFFLGG